MAIVSFLGTNGIGHRVRQRVELCECEKLLFAYQQTKLTDKHNTHNECLCL